MRLSQCLTEFLKRQQLKNNSPATIENYRLIVSAFIQYCGDIDCSTLSADTVNNYNLYLRNRVKLVSVRTYIRHIRIFVNFCIHSGYCSNIYHDIVIPQSGKKVVDILTPSQVKKLLACFDNSFYGIRNKAMVILMLDCGLRANEVITLRLADINFEYGYIKVCGKGNKERIVPIGNSCSSALSDYLLLRPSSDCCFCFLAYDGSALTRSVFKKMFRYLRKSSGIHKLHPHLLRHTFATNYLLYGSGDIYSLSMLLGHSDIKTTEIYLHYANYYSFMQHKQTFSFVDYINSGPLDSSDP